jgi:hypothetical protein
MRPRLSDDLCIFHHIQKDDNLILLSCSFLFCLFCPASFRSARRRTDAGPHYKRTLRIPFLHLHTHRHTMVFTLVVHLWTQPGKEAEMKDILIEASQTYLKDKGTINWFVMQDAQDPTAWSIVERYEDAGVSRRRPMPRSTSQTDEHLCRTSKPTKRTHTTRSSASLSVPSSTRPNRCRSFSTMSFDIGRAAREGILV